MHVAGAGQHCCMDAIGRIMASVPAHACYPKETLIKAATLTEDSPSPTCPTMGARSPVRQTCKRGVRASQRLLVPSMNCLVRTSTQSSTLCIYCNEQCNAGDAIVHESGAACSRAFVASSAAHLLPGCLSETPKRTRRGERLARTRQLGSPAYTHMEGEQGACVDTEGRAAHEVKNTCNSVIIQGWLWHWDTPISHERTLQPGRMLIAAQYAV